MELCIILQCIKVILQCTKVTPQCTKVMLVIHLIIQPILHHYIVTFHPNMSEIFQYSTMFMSIPPILPKISSQMQNITSLGTIPRFLLLSSVPAHRGPLPFLPAHNVPRFFLPSLVPVHSDLHLVPEASGRIGVTMATQTGSYVVIT